MWQNIALVATPKKSKGGEILKVKNFQDRRSGPSFFPVYSLWGLLAGLIPTMAQAEYALNLPAPASDLAQSIYDLHTLILWICLAILIVVFIPMALALVRHRKSVGHVAAKFHDNLLVEIIWTIIPILILIYMAWPAAALVVSMKDTSKEDLTIKVTAHQWKWEYEYLGDNIRFISNSSTPKEQIEGLQPKGEHYLLEVDRPMVVPAGKKVRLVMTASDVIHAWWVPAFGVKQDAIPGFIRDTWFKVDKPGTYRGQCAELCGVNHGFMPIVVEVVPPEQFASWKNEQIALVAAAAANANKVYELAELKDIGEKVYAANCAACHQPNGEGLPGAFPGLSGSKMVNEDKAGHIDIVINGKPATAMAAFGKQLSDLDIAAVVTYERNSWGNKTGDVVQPADIAAHRK
ncbi:Cytochrome c oxidase subunit 2 [Candidatus Propionivibrio aalborgensis]|uniref:Cytochrome c oxidase subunit 2 n=1 Tax=Candidatus Propionivibrio aalborgensis TaxID=1860101 RepID=A0A1A8Y1V0_9RHOO|nr:cytochrome c oxidase subunit II [Candidatus Propionivibrio aalborgensis]SBT10972.1 Cytochrome c oxidase subunit 2 [Candidatus Propionivibrio aalborgensis]HRC59389.1 cytochrome c oxidase subunit II [Candidatus Propionivibrio aalborgensis]